MRVTRRSRSKASESGSSAPTSKARLPRSRHQRRLNRKALACLAVAALLVGVTYLAFWQVRLNRIRSQVMAGAIEQEKRGQIDLAIRNLSNYLAQNPEEVAPLELLARIMADSARSLDEAMAAAQTNDHLIRLDPDGPGRQETRRRTVDLYVRCGDAYRISAIVKMVPEAAAHDLRYRAAEGIARELLRRGGDGPKDHGLLGMALEGLAVPGNPEALRESIREYEIAMKGDPGDPITAERLARLYRERMNDPDQGERALDGLVRASPDSFEARLVRHRFFLALHQVDRAGLELEKATTLAPDNLSVRLSAANYALRRDDPSAARRHLAALPESLRSDIRVRVMEGMIDFSEDRPEEAIDGWRQGLMMIGGIDADLTWWLAHALLKMGRVAEARPLIAQYRRLSENDEQPLYRFLQAELNEKTGRPTRAIIELEWIRDRIDASWQATVNVALGRCYEAIWDLPRALAAYHRAIQVDPRQAGPRIDCARLLLARKPIEAINEIERGLALTPEDSSLRIALVTARLRQQVDRPADQRSWADFDQAMRRAVEASPRSSALVPMMADRLELGGDRPGAIGLLRQEAEKSPRIGSLWSAWSSVLVRSGNPIEGLKVLERAAGPSAAGDRSTIRIARAQLLFGLGRGREAREVLSRGEKDLPLGDRPLIWEALGRLDAARGDLKGARASFTEWSKLLPEDPRPRLALVELAQASGDESAIRSTVEALRELGGPEDIAWRLSRAQELLWSQNHVSRPGFPRSDARLVEAVRLLEAVLIDAPEVPAAHLLRAQAMERLNKADEAIISYRRALDRGISKALPRLIELLIGRRKFEDLVALRQKVSPVQLDQLSAMVTLRSGDVEMTSKFVDLAAKDGKDIPGTRIWQAKILETMGKADEAEAVLRSIAEEFSSEPGPWFSLIQAQVSHGKATDAAASVVRARGLVNTSNPVLLEGRLRWAAGDLPAADRSFQMAVAERPDDPIVRSLAARFFEEAGRRADALNCLRAALAANPGNRIIARQLAVLLSTDPRSWQESASLIGLESSPDDPPEVRLDRAQIVSMALDPGQKLRSLDLFEALIKDLSAENPITIVARKRLATLLIEVNRPERACEIAAPLAELGTDPASMALSVEALLRAKRWSEALRQIDRLDSLPQMASVASGSRVRCLIASSRPGEAPESLERAVLDRRLRPDAESFGRAAFGTLILMGPPALDHAERVGRFVAGVRPSASWMLGQVQLNRGRVEEALKLSLDGARADGAEDRRGASRVAMNVAARPDVNAADLSTSESILETALGRDPRDYDVIVMMAMFRHRQGRYDDEARLYRSTLEMRPFDPISSNNLAWVLSEGLGHPDQALELIDKFVARSGQSRPTLDTRGVILTRLGRFDEAIDDLKEAARLGSSPANFFHLARACQKANRTQDFRRYRDEARRSGVSASKVDPSERTELESLLSL